MNKRKTKFTLIEVMIVVAIIALLALLALPNFMSARRRARQVTCITNLRQLESSKAVWSIYSNQPDEAVPTINDVFPYLSTPSLEQFYCPLDPDKSYATSYSLGNAAVLVNCNFSTATYPHEL